ncbi:hypothetical protein O3M35_004323 [Rhynocoris fuscipes]|uniref:Alpha-galactosidase n=1 Tax=Rhynocoris fuscipes TaxID=488301 RepID=A0AAW1CH55_9HEMI
MRVHLELCLVLLCLVGNSIALDNGLALTPPMGFMTWQRYRCTVDCKLYPDECISDKLIRRIADLMVDGGYLEAGYEYLIIDDCWLERNRSADGHLQEDKIRFPHGMPALVKYVHSKGLKFGIYENYGTLTCAGYPGLYGHEKKDITMFAEWGIDYIKVDGCYFPGLTYAKGYETLRHYLNQTGRPIVYSCSYPSYDEDNSVPIDYKLLSENCNLWRNYEDIDDSLASLESIMDYFALKQDIIAPYAGPGHWNDPDMLLIGNYGLSYEQSKMQMAIWSILAAPLLMSTELASIEPKFKDILLNKDIIKVNQDKYGIQGLRVYKSGSIEVWTRKISPKSSDNYSYAIAICSRKTDGMPFRYTVSLKRIMLYYQSGYRIKDLYSGEEHPQLYYPDSNLTVRLNPTGVVFLKATIKL